MKIYFQSTTASLTIDANGGNVLSDAEITCPPQFQPQQPSCSINIDDDQFYEPMTGLTIYAMESFSNLDIVCAVHVFRPPIDQLLIV